jgi:hypothetical protein
MTCKFWREVFAAFPLLLVGVPAFAQDTGLKLCASWGLVSFYGANRRRGCRAPGYLRSRPFGRLILTPAHTIAAFLSRPDRKPPSNEAEARRYCLL